MSKIFLVVAVVLSGFVAGGCFVAAQGDDVETVGLLNVSYDPTRELWKEINAAFTPIYEKEHNVRLKIENSHAGSSSQARQVIDGQKADVVTLAMWADTNAIAKAGLIEKGWEDRFPDRSLPYTSTIVFVVRKGNPKKIKDWADLVRSDVGIITPSPETSGNGKLSFLAAWGSVILNGGSEEDARAFVAKLYNEHVKVLDSGARGATLTFTKKQIGDVHLTWENEAHLELKESADQELEIVYPSQSIRAEPHVAVVDANVKKSGKAALAEAYLKFLYTPAAQEIIAKNFYRPSSPEVLAKFSETLPPIKLFPITAIAASWDDANTKFFAAGGVFSQIQSQTTR